MAASILVSVINESTVVDDADVQNVVAALQVQVSSHFAPVWGVDATLQFVPKGAAPPANTWWLVILDNSDQAGTLGYHDLTTDGLPLGKVFAATDLQYNMQWSVTASHELLEMLGDPNINLVAAIEPGRNGSIMTLYAYEVADACEADSYGYQINGVLVSDFVYPAWFESFWTQSTAPRPQFDYQRKITQPFQLLPGGYISVYDVASGQGWEQLTAQATSQHYASRAPVGSRRERRRIPRNQWVRSVTVSREERVARTKIGGPVVARAIESRLGVNAAAAAPGPLATDPSKLVVGGFSMSLGNGDAYWTIVPAAVCRECVQTGSPTNKVTLADILAAKKTVVYSYGTASWWYLSNGQVPAGQTMDLLIIVAGVNDIWEGQGSSVWNAPSWVKKCVCFQPTHAVPVSQPLRNAGVAWFDIDDPGLLAKLSDPSLRYININCDSLFSPDPLTDVMTCVAMHTGIKDRPEVISVIRQLMA